MRSPSRLQGLDGLRGLAALGIVVLHVWMWTGQHDPTQPVLLNRALGELRQGVTLFFVLSGFLLAGPWIARRPPRLGRFALRRAARILPAYWLALLGSFALLHRSGHPLDAHVEHLPLFLAFAENHFLETAGKLDPPMWSLCVEVTFYAVLPVAGWLMVRRGPLVVAAGLCAIGLAWTAAGVDGAWPTTAMRSLPTYLPVFACGIAAAALSHRRSPSRHESALLIGVGATLVLANSWWHSAPHGAGRLGFLVLDLPAAAGFAMIVAAVARRPSRVLASPPLRALGTLSYGVYLWHLPVLLWWKLRGQLPVEPLDALVHVLVPTLVLAAISWLVVERPVLRWATAGSRRVPHAARASGRVAPQAAGAGGG